MIDRFIRELTELTSLKRYYLLHRVMRMLRYLFAYMLILLVGASVYMFYQYSTATIGSYQFRDTSPGCIRNGTRPMYDNVLYELQFDSLKAVMGEKKYINILQGGIPDTRWLPLLAAKHGLEDREDRDQVVWADTTCLRQIYFTETPPEKLWDESPLHPNLLYYSLGLLVILIVTAIGKVGAEKLLLKKLEERLFPVIEPYIDEVQEPDTFFGQAWISMKEVFQELKDPKVATKLFLQSLIAIVLSLVAALIGKVLLVGSQTCFVE